MKISKKAYFKVFLKVKKPKPVTKLVYIYCLGSLASENSEKCWF